MNAQKNKQTNIQQKADSCPSVVTVKSQNSNLLTQETWCLKDSLKLEYLKITIKRHFLSLPPQICRKQKVSELKKVLGANREGGSQHGKNCFQDMRNQLLPESYTFSSSAFVMCA